MLLLKADTQQQSIFSFSFSLKKEENRFRLLDGFFE